MPLSGKRTPGKAARNRSLRTSRAPDLRVILTDDRRLYFSLGITGSKPKIFGGLDFGDLASSLRIRRRSKPEKHRGQAPESFGGGSLPEGRAKAWIEVNVTRVAKNLKLE